jgi:hypothetical protein
MAVVINRKKIHTTIKFVDRIMMTDYASLVLCCVVLLFSSASAAGDVGLSIIEPCSINGQRLSLVFGVCNADMTEDAIATYWIDFFHIGFDVSAIDATAPPPPPNDLYTVRAIDCLAVSSPRWWKEGEVDGTSFSCHDHQFSMPTHGCRQYITVSESIHVDPLLRQAVFIGIRLQNLFDTVRNETLVLRGDASSNAIFHCNVN